MLGVLVAGVLIGIAMVAFMQMFKFQNNASQQIAGKDGVNDLSHAIDTLFGSAKCGTTGIYLSAGNPAVVSVSGANYSLSLDTLEFPNGSVAVTSLSNPNITNMIRPYSVSALTMMALGGGGAYGLGFQYPFKMQVTFGSPLGPPPLPLSKFLTVYTDASQNVIGACYLAPGTTGSFGGIFSQIVQNEGLTPPANCFYPNPFTGGCSCPAGFTAQLFHSWVTTCLNSPSEPLFSSWNCSLYQPPNTPVAPGTYVGLVSFACYR